MKAVSIKWYDSYSLDDSWHKIGDVPALTKDPFMCYTTGYLYRKDKNQVVICHTYNDEQLCGVMVIPRRCISEIHYL